MTPRAIVGLIALSGTIVAIVVVGFAFRPSVAPAAPAPAPPIPVARAPELAERDLRSLSGAVGDEDGAPVARALACAHPAFGAPVACVATGGDGRFALVVPVGFHKLEVVAPAGSLLVGEWYEDRDRSRDAALLDLRREDRGEVAIALARGRRIAGRVLAAGTLEPIGDATVCANPTDSPGEWLCERTDTQGRYALVVPAARYLIFFVPPEGTRLIPRWWDGALDVLGARFLDVRPFDALGVDGLLPEGHLISGTVRAASGQPVERALVCADTPFPTGRICRHGDKEGRYSIAVRSGIFLVQFKPPASSLLVSEWYGGAADPRDARRVVVDGDVQVDAALRAGQMIWGRVQTKDGELPIEGATVNVYDASQPCCVAVASAIAGIGGDYAAVVPVGRYWVEAFPPATTPYVSGFSGGSSVVERARVVEVTAKEDSLADVALEEFRPPS